MQTITDESRASNVDATDATTAAPSSLDVSSDDRELNGLWLLFVPAIVLIGYAVDLGGGTMAPGAMLPLALAAICAAAAVALGSLEWPGMQWRGGAVTIGTLGVAIAIQFCLALRSVPVPNLQISGINEYGEYLSGVGLAAVLAGGVLASRPFLGRATLPVMVVAFVAIGAWIIQHTAPGIDVLMFQRDASAALLKGTNPYRITFTDPYLGQRPQWFGPGLAHDGRLWFGYPYMPLDLWLALPAHVLAADIRYAHLAAMALAGLLIGYARITPVNFAAAALCLFMSRTQLIVSLGWTEPFILLTLAGVLFCAARAPRLVPWAAGLFLASKQYVPLCAPLMLLLCPRPWTVRWIAAFALKAIIAASIVTLPLVLWDPRAFWHSAVAVQLTAPFRGDALSFTAAFGDPQRPPSAVWAFVAMAAAMGLSLWRCPRNAAGFCGGVAVSFLMFFAFNKQAFANYYYFVIGAMCCAIAAAMTTDASVDRAARTGDAT